MRLKIFVLNFLLLFFLVSPLFYAESTSSKSGKILKDVLDEYWQYRLEESPYLRLKYGLKVEKLPDLSKKRADYQVDKARYFLKKLEKINEKEIGHEDFLTLHIFKWGLENSIAGHKYFYFYFPITPYASIFPYLNRSFSQFRFKSSGDADNYADLLKQYPRVIGDVLALLKQQYKQKYIVPKVELDAVFPYLESIIQTGDKSQFYPSAERLAKLPPDRAKSFQQEVAKIVEGQVNPAFKQLIGFIKGDYYRAAPNKVGLSQYAGGKDYYRFLVKISITLSINPEEVHRTGLKEVERLNGELDKIRKEVKFEGDRRAFLDFLKTAPRFKPKTAEEIGEKLMFFNKQAEAKIDLLFLTKPKAPCGVKRLDPALEGVMTYGYYQEPTALEPTGYYLYNGSKLEERTVLDAASLILHELTPGHHFQVAIQNENEKLPRFRRVSGQTAFVEGWAEYAAQLGREIGIYEDPYDRCGLILQDLMMSVRLVVDTGMNYFGWSREKASRYMREHLTISETEIATETLRYAVDIPGQALAYKMGHLFMWKLRQKTEKALGEKFDIRKFHDVLIGSGSMPLAVLERHVDWFIARECAAPPEAKK